MFECRDWFVDWLDKGFIYEKSFEVCLLMTEFDCPGVPLYSWQDVKIQLQTNLDVDDLCSF